MDFSHSEAQHDLAKLARRILGDWDGKNAGRALGGFDPELWSAMARAGLLDAALPSGVGGGGFGLLEQCSVLIEVGRAVAPVPYAASIVGAASTLAELGSGRQAERWVVPIARGARTMALALADEGSAPGFTAEATEGGWRVSGVQPAVLSGAAADGFLCEAQSSDGPLLLIVGKDDDGVSVLEQEAVDGSGAAQLELSDVVVHDDARVDGVPGWARERLTVGLCAQQLGVLERALELTAEYARSREQFGKPIGSFQAVRQRLADTYLDVEAVRLTLWQAAWRLSEGLPAVEEVATAKYWAAQAGHRVAHTAVHVHGGVGIDLDYPLHRYFATAKRLEFALGGATAQLRTIGAALADNPA